MECLLLDVGILFVVLGIDFAVCLVVLLIVISVVLSFASLTCLDVGWY